MGLKLLDHGSAEYKQMVQLRFQILRQPLGLTFTQEELDVEKDDILIAAFDEEEILGCCMLCKVDEHRLRLRQMAVLPDSQMKGVGATIISFAENIAKDRGFQYIIMHARDTAIGFYQKFGYRIVGDAFTEVNLPHHIMEKALL